ncbi:MAG TPA: AMP-binding protein [Burkholderiales bacterium]|nr:AMP-binding protein [Burkholderiales bacterium]
MMLARPSNGVEQLLGEAALARHGQRLALIGGDERVTYAELAHRVARSSAALAVLGVRPGARVLFLMRDTPTFAAAWLGAVRMGAVAVALNSKLSEVDYRHILADSDARLVLVEDVFARARPDLNEELARSRRLVVSGSPSPDVPCWEDLLSRAVRAAPCEATPESPAFLLYSSGTTGRPKGILHAHRAFGVVGGALRLLGIGEGARVVATSKLFFAYGLEHGLLGPLAVGATSILCADWPDAEALAGIVEREQPDALFSVPTLYRRLLSLPAAQAAALRAVRVVVSAGERLSPALVAQWRNAIGTELLNLYGMSETFCACLVTPPGTSDGQSTGAALPGVETRIEEGVLWVRHPSLADGYVNLPERTRESFRDGWFCTRDLFTEEGGILVHQGRADELMKIAGQWVHPAEVEAAVASLAEVAEAVCVAVPDADGLERLALFLTARESAEDAVRAAESACDAALPRHRRPKWIRAVAELPRTATGKVQRFRLRELLAGAAADRG